VLLWFCGSAAVEVGASGRRERRQSPIAPLLLRFLMTKLHHAATKWLRFAGIMSEIVHF
jgi:hypothetical protein